jgi:hypothetical protein
MEIKHMYIGQQKLEQFTFSEIYASTIRKHLYVKLGTSVTVFHVVNKAGECNYFMHIDTFLAVCM